MAQKPPKPTVLPEVPATSEEALSVAMGLDLPEAWKATLRALYGDRQHRGTDKTVHTIKEAARISALEGYEILRLVSEHSFSRTLEIGCAYGFSTLWILGGLLGRGLHIAVDPFELTQWHGIGLQKVKEAECEKNFRFIEDYSAGALTELRNNGQKFDLIFIDGNHKFDGVMVDIAVSDKILEVGGFLIFDDLWMPSVQTALSFLESNMAYRRLANKCSNSGIYKKISDDERKWTHFVDFGAGAATPQSPLPVVSSPNRLKQCRHGLMLYNPNDRFVGRSLDLYAEFSAGEAALFAQCVKPGFVVLDLGANIGAHTLLFAAAAGPGGRVIAFEPQRLIFQTLCANMALNNVTNVHCQNEAVGAEPGTLRVPVLDPEKEQNFGGLSLEGQTEGEAVARVTVDSLGLGRCNFMKIDVEGMEVPAIEGAAETIRRHRPVLYVENDRRQHSGALIRLIASLGYRLHWHLPRLFNPDNFAANPENVFGDTISRNMLCLPTESTVKVENMRPVEIP